MSITFASETFVRQKYIRIRLNFLRFHIRSMHFDRKGWGIQKKTRKNECENFGLSVQWPLVLGYPAINCIYLLICFFAFDKGVAVAECDLLQA